MRIFILLWLKKNKPKPKQNHSWLFCLGGRCFLPLRITRRRAASSTAPGPPGSARTNPPRAASPSPARLPTYFNSQHPHPVSPSTSVLTSVSGASLMHLRTSALPGAAKGSGSESLSQLQRISYVTLLSVYIQPHLLTSCSHSLCGQRRQLRCWVFFFSLYSHY